MIATIPVKDEASAKRVERMKNMMRADQVAQLAVALASPATKDVSGQIFAARGNEIFLMSQPRPVRGIGKVEGWTPETIAEHAMPALKPSFSIWARRRACSAGIRFKRRSTSPLWGGRNCEANSGGDVCERRRPPDVLASLRASTSPQGEGRTLTNTVRVSLCGTIFRQSSSCAADGAWRRARRIGPLDLADFEVRFECDLRALHAIERDDVRHPADLRVKRPANSGGSLRTRPTSSFNSRRIASAGGSAGPTPPPGRCQPF